MKELVADDERVKVCFDTNHITIQKPEDVIISMADRIVILHISDFDFINERHWLPGEGKINWQATLKALSEIGYYGAFMYEVGYACPKTILRNRNLTTTDFVRNANELFSGADITLISFPKPGLGIDELNEELIAQHIHDKYPGQWEPTTEWDNEWANDREWS